MSTSRSRLTRSIQEIAKRDPDLRRAIEATKPRGDQPSAAGVGTSDAERDRICCDGSVSDDANPGTEERDTSEGGQDASGGLNADDTADISDMGPGSLTGLHDCATGEPVCFEGADWLPPDGWESPTEPPLDDGWEEGYYWIAWNGTASDNPSLGTPFFSCGAARAFALQGGCAGPSDPGCPSGFWQINANCGYAVYHSYRYQRYSCPGYYPEMCVSQEDAPRETDWPSDSCVNLAIRGGSIVGSKYDPENDGSYSKPMAEIELCDDFGNSFNLAPAANGGWKTINLTNGKDGYLYDSLGNQVARISGSEYSDPNV